MKEFQCIERRQANVLTMFMKHSNSACMRECVFLLACTIACSNKCTNTIHSIHNDKYVCVAYFLCIIQLKSFYTFFIEARAENLFMLLFLSFFLSLQKALMMHRLMAMI